MGEAVLQCFLASPAASNWREAPTYCPSINGYFVRYRRCAQILILEICQYIPPVKIFAHLDLDQTVSSLDGHYLIQLDLSEKALHQR